MSDSPKLSNRDIIDIEEKAGIDFSEIVSGERFNGKLIAAMTWVIRRKNDRAFTFDQALDEPCGDSLQELKQLRVLMIGDEPDDDEDPTEPSDESAG